MRTWYLQLPKPARWVVVLMTGIILIPVALVLAALLEWWLGSLERIQAETPRIERVLGYIAVESELEEAVANLDAKLEKSTFSSLIEASQAGAEMQQMLRQFAESAGMTVRGSQLDQKFSDEAEQQSYDLLTVQLNMVGDPAAVDDFLRQVHEAVPLMVIQSLRISEQRLSSRERRKRRREGLLSNEELDVLIRVSAARLTEEGS